MDSTKLQNNDSTASSTSDLPEDKSSETKKTGEIAEPAATAKDSYVGKYIGSYQILERLGAGGMGAVYLAKRLNSDFKQKVALKIIKRGMDTEAILRRFANERKILSSLKHPNIAQLLDGKVSSHGVPFFVMEYVEGAPIHKFCREKNLSLEARLKLFREVCSAVEYAHKNLVIHRDLKPSNILVTDENVPKLLDFGIAKLLDDSEETSTATHENIFTVEYAAPEQITGKTVTTAADVYSLGVILYELLTGARPFDAKNRAYYEVVKSICETEPQKPSETGENRHFTEENESPTAQIPKSKLRGDLDNIILKALRKEPEERYGSVQQFSADIKRFLEGLPVSARSQTVRYRFEKYVKRHKAGVFAVVLIALSLVGGISAATWQAFVAKRERAKAEQRFGDVRKLANSVIFEYQDSLGKIAGTTEVRQKMLGDAVAYLDGLSAESTEDQDLQRELARAYIKVGDIQGNTGNVNRSRFDAAEASFKKALVLNEDIVRKNPQDAALLNALDENYKKLAGVERVKGNLPESTAYFEKSVEVERRLLALKPDDVTALQGLAWSQINLATQREEPHQVDESLKICREALDVFENLLAKEPDNAAYQNNLPAAYEAYADILMAKPGKSGEALEYYGKVLALLEAKLRRTPDDFETKQRIALEHGYIADALDLNGKPAEARNSYEKSIALYDEVIALDAKNEYAVFERAFMKAMFGRFLVKTGEPAKAIEILQEPLVVLPARFAENPQEYVADFFAAFAYQSYAEAEILLYKTGSRKDRDKLKNAQESLEKSVSIYSKYVGKVVVPRMSAQEFINKASEDLRFCRQNLQI